MTQLDQIYVYSATRN